MDKQAKRVFNMEKVTIITRAFNRLEYTIDCINLVQSNTHYENYEHVIVNNHSWDGTKEWLDWVKERGLFPKVRAFHSEENRGDWGGMLWGFLKACQSSSFVVQLDNDIEVPPGWLTAMLDVYKKNFYFDGELRAGHGGGVMLKRRGIAPLPYNIYKIDTEGKWQMVFVSQLVACYLVAYRDCRNEMGKYTCSKAFTSNLRGGLIKITNLECEHMDGNLEEQNEIYPRKYCWEKL